MAARDEVIRYVYQVSGSPELKRAAEQLLEVGDVSDDTAQSLRALADEFGKAKSASAAVSAYQALIATQEELADAVDRTGLRLQFAAEQEASTAAALRESEAALAAAKIAQAEYAEQTDKTVEGQRAVRDAVRAAGDAQKAAQAEWRTANGTLQEATRNYERAATAQDKMQRESADLAKQLKDAGLATDQLGDAQAELATRAERTQAELDGLVSAAREAKSAADSLAASDLAEELREQAHQAQLAAQAERALADAAAAVSRAQAQAAAAAERRAQTEAAFLQRIRDSAAQEQRAARATENLQKARELLAQRSAAAGASEQRYAAALGGSAAKIAAIGAAALGINGAVGLARSGLEQLIETAGKFQSLDVQLDSLFGNESTEALTAIQQFAQETPYQLQQVSDAFVKLKAFGLDPLDGTFDAIADQAAKLGGQQETLTGITLALGQAWAKQKLQGEEILQLVERGVPVWELLQRATNKNVTELQKLSEAGKLGRKEIKLLIDEIGRSADGASASLAGTLPGQINRLKGQWADFLNLIANSGVLDYLQEQLASVSAEVERMAATGELQEWARDIADAIVGAARAIQGVTGFIIENREAIAELAVAYGSFKAVQLIGGMAQALASLGTQLLANTRAMAGAAAGTAAMSGPLGLLAAALAFTGTQFVQLVTRIREYRDEMQAAEDSARTFEVEQQALAESSRERQAQYAEQAKVVAATTSELAIKSANDTRDYIKQLEGAIQYTRALGMEAIATGDNVGRLAARGKLDTLEAALEAARARMVALKESSALTFEIVGQVGIKAAEAFDEMIAKGETARKAVGGIFDDIDLTSTNGLTKAAGMVAAIGARGTEAARAVRDELRAQIIKLSDEDFAKFARIAPAAFRSAMQGAKELQGAVENINLERLGVDIEEIRTGFSSAGRVAIQTFQAARAEVETLGLTAEQKAQAIGIAFDNALGQAKTKKDFEALQDSLQKAFGAGSISANAFMAKVEQVRASIASIGTGNVNGKPVDAGAGALRGAAQAAGELGQAAGDAADQVVEGQQQIATQSVGVATAYVNWINEFTKTSEQAGQRFQQLTRDIYNARTIMLSNLGDADATGFARFGAALSAASQQVQDEIAKQRGGVAAVADSYANLSDSAVMDMARVRGGHADLADGLRQVATEARAGRSEFDLLGASDLSPLASAADALAARVRRLAEETANAKREFADMASAYQDQIDQINGNEDAAETRRHKRALEQLRERAEEAGALNSSEYSDAVAKANELHALKLRQLREQEAASRRASESNGSGSSGSSGSSSNAPRSGSGSAGGLATLNLNFGNGQNVNVQAPANMPANEFLELLRRQMMGSGLGGSIGGR